MKTRLEHDLLGEREIPQDVYYGIQSVRAQENFDITGITLSKFPQFITSLAKVKKAVALANFELNLLNEKKKNAICEACDEIIEGKLHEQFIVDMIQGGAGTSVNMNINEVVANRALEIMGHKKGEYKYLHPNNDVNLSQSTNDAYPTALRITLYEKIYELIDSMRILEESFERKALEFHDVIKMGRTQLQDAVPMTLGQEFSIYSVMIAEDIQRLKEAQQLVREMNLGATAKNLIEATQDTGAYVQISGVFKRVVVKIHK